jgi:hypothetical protein
MTDSGDKRLTIGLQAEWGTGPLWVSERDDFPEPYSADEIADVISLSEGLRRAIAAWNERFQGIYNDTAPQDSAFDGPDEEAQFVVEGRELARRMREELPSAVVVQYGGLDSGDWEEV